MNKVLAVEDIINRTTIPPGSTVYISGNAATPRLLLKQLAVDESIKGINTYGVLPLGNGFEELFSEKRCRDITHRVIFNSHLTREAVNRGWAYYCPIHLAEIPRYLKEKIHPNVVLLTVSGPDRGGNYSLGTTVEAVLMAIRQAKDRGGLVIAERNARMPFVQGTTIHKRVIDYLIESDYDLPVSPVHEADENARRIGEIIASLYIQDGSKENPGSTLQYGIGEVPEAVTTAILRHGIKDLSIHTELFAGAMARLVKAGTVTNRWKKHLNFSVASIFLAEDQAGYDWMHNNSSIQSRPCNYTNSIFKIAEHPRMVSINSAIGVDLHGNIWADSLDARKIYSGIGGQADFIRGAQWSEGGVAIIALKSKTSDGISKVVDMCPAGITTTAIPADQVILVTENGTVDPRGLSLGERAVAIAHAAHDEEREILLRIIYENPAFHKPDAAISGKVPGFVSYEEALNR